MIDRFTLFVLLAGCLFFAAVVFLEVGPEPEEMGSIAAPMRPPAGSPARSEPRARAEDLIATILARPLFGSTRRPAPAEAADKTGYTELSDTRLAGILTEPGRRLAIFVPAGAKPIMVTEGDSVAGWRIDSITPLAVSLTGPGGVKTLQPKIDPNLAPPPPPPPPQPTTTPAPPSARVRGQAAPPVLPEKPGAPANLPSPPPRPGLAGARR